MMFRERVATVCLFLLLSIPGLVAATTPATDLIQQLPVPPAGEVMVPDQFLRRWDPVTFFFDSSQGPEKGGAENRPERLLKLTPSHPGAYTWLNSRVLQFRPAEPWPPLTRYSWTFDGHKHELLTLFSPPLSTLPANGATGLDPVEALTLTFAEPVDAKALARMLSIELRPLPGVASDQSRWLSEIDYELKVMERNSRSDKARYVLSFNEPIPEGTHVGVHMRLSLDDQLEQSFHDIEFSTAAPFTVTRVDCAGQGLSITDTGVHYGRENAIRCPGTRRAVDVSFSARPEVIDPVQARNLLRFTPSVEGLSFSNAGNSLSIAGKFEENTLYRIDLKPTAIKDDKGRALNMAGGSELYLFFPKRADFLRWDASQGIVERYGPQMVPLQGRGYERLDLRIHKVDPLNRAYWPFPDQAVVIDESTRPPGPGEEPGPYESVRASLASIGSPSVSTLVDLPLRKSGGSARFGLDLKPYLQQISGGRKPGTYLVGMRRLDQQSSRAWIRVQVTDLALSTLEDVDHVRFLVSSLRSGEAVGGARVVVEGMQRGNWITVNSGTTDGQGVVDWEAPGLDRHNSISIRRIVVSKGEDTLVLDTSRAPERFADNHWDRDSSNWLQWAVRSLQRPQSDFRCHTFTERPVYKPEDPVYIKGYVRKIDAGEIKLQGGRKGTLKVNGPGDKEWSYEVALSPSGSFDYIFAEDKLPTGDYSVQFQDHERLFSCSAVSFKKEAFRLPRFEVNLNGPGVSALDQPFKVLMNAKYYAGGLVAGRPVRWRVTQFPYNWMPSTDDGFAYSTDARYTSSSSFQSTPVLNSTATSDEHGMSELSVDPTIEPTAQPRRYVIEATVTGADDQTVTSTHEVRVLPPFTLGMKLPRYLPKADLINPEIVAIGPDGKPVVGQSIKLKLLHRQWHSHLQASDFTQGDAKYITDVVDELVSEKEITSTLTPLKLSLPVKGAGVYVVQLESQDKLGRSQVLQLDLFAGGKQAVTWSRPPPQSFTAATDREEYAPGETVKFVLQSPYQRARAVVAIEQPNGRNEYHFIDVRNGSATFSAKVRKEYVPRFPVHFLLMRGRVDEATAAQPGELDLAKPSTLATTTWVTVNPRDNRVEVALDYPQKAQPGDEVTLKIKLHDHRDKPLAGEVTLWLVDQAVLALGKEQRLDPLPDFLPNRESRGQLHDTRNLTLGRLPLQELPGGDGGEAERASLLDNVTIRKNFSPVPFYKPGISVDASGTATVKIKLPDNLTNFKVRAKVVSGADRFGFASGMIAVRLPVIVQPSLPRFVRPGDSFTATAIGRIVEGKGGPGRASIKADGLTLEGQAEQHFNWQANRPQRIDYRVSVPTPGYTDEGKLEREEVSVTLGVERSADKAKDAFSISVPIKPDRRPVISRQLKTLNGGELMELSAVSEPVRPGTLQRALLISDQPALVRMAAGISYLMSYPYGCTEQRISRSRVMLASNRLDRLMNEKSDDQERERVIGETLRWIERAIDANGLVGYWPGSTGYVSVTAWATLFTLEARDAGFQVNSQLLDRMLTALQQSLRSDYRYFIQGAAYSERVWALNALAAAGRLDTAYAAELARRSDYLDLESTAQLTRLLSSSNSAEAKTLKMLNDRLWGGIVTRLYNGNEIYGGLQKTAMTAPREVLPSETRTISEVLRAVLTSSGDMTKKKQLLLDALTTLGQDDGWGSTNANAAALLALSEFLSQGNGAVTQPVGVQFGSSSESLTVGGQSPMVAVTRQSPLPVKVTLPTGATQSIVVRSETRYIPQQDGSHVTALAQGFVISRELQKIAVDSNAPPERTRLDKPALQLALKVGDVIEEHVELVNPEDRHYVAVTVPLAAGMEPLNPALATAPPEAKPAGVLTLVPAYVEYLDDHMAYYYNTLPKGTYDFYFRTRATTPGSYTQPPAYAEMMYRQATAGNGNGARVIITPVDGPGE